MAMAKCKECKSDVSSWANKCPHCGVSHPAVTSPQMFVGVLIVLGTLFGLFSCMAGSDEAEDRFTLRASDLGEAWPLSVSEGSLLCLSGNRLVLSTKAGRYALNGAAAPRPGDKWETIEPIWLAGAYEGTRKNIGPLIDLAKERCKSAGQWR